MTCGGWEGAPHLNFLPWGEAARPPGPTRADLRAGSPKVSVGKGAGAHKGRPYGRELSLEIYAATGISLSFRVDVRD